MDLTPEFEALTKTRGQPRHKRYTPLDKATILVAKINKFKSYLFNYGHHYLDTYNILQGGSTMLDEIRNKLDGDVEEFIKQCREAMKILQSEIRLDTTSPQVIEHRGHVIDMVMRMLNDFVNIYSSLRTTRIKRVTQKQKIDRIVRDDLDQSNMDDPLNLEDAAISTISDEGSEEKLTTTMSSQTSTSRFSSGGGYVNKNISDNYEQQSLIASEHDANLSQQEIVHLRKENSKMHEELLTVKDEVQSIHRKVNQISKLQELFREKVQEQEVELNELHETAIKSSENVRDGNELIRDVMMKNASTRVFILSYIITLGFTILFLHWYNP